MDIYINIYGYQKIKVNEYIIICKIFPKNTVITYMITCLTFIYSVSNNY